MSKKDHLEIEEGKEVVRRTIVGGRPRARRKRKVRVPIGIEKVLYRAAADTLFRESLFRDRKGAVDEAGFRLMESELAILRSVPDSVLTTMIEKIDLKKHGKRKFMRAVGTCALAATTAAAGAGCPVDDSEGRSTRTSGDVVQDVGADNDDLNFPDLDRDVPIYPDAVAGIPPDLDPDDIEFDQPELMPAGILPDMDDADTDADDMEVDEGDIISAGVDISDPDIMEMDVDIDLIEGITPDMDDADQMDVETEDHGASFGITPDH